MHASATSTSLWWWANGMQCSRVGCCNPAGKIQLLTAATQRHEQLYGELSATHSNSHRVALSMTGLCRHGLCMGMGSALPAGAACAG